MMRVGKVLCAVKMMVDRILGSEIVGYEPPLAGMYTKRFKHYPKRLLDRLSGM